jgi:AraC family transcriptional regulator, regulatory protein of adaptative response / DNA-3-methyladenine glycosylase II
MCPSPVRLKSTRELRPLDYLPPLDGAALLGFFRERAIAEVECVGEDWWARTVRITENGQSQSGWIACRLDPQLPRVWLAVSESLMGVLAQVAQRVRTAFDLDADPTPINGVLSKSFPEGDGLRVPGGVDGFEIAVRAILGQQVSVAAARTFALRLVARFGDHLLAEDLPDWCAPSPVLNRLFPTPRALAEAPAQALGELGIVRQRQKAIHALSCAVLSEEILLEPLRADPGRIEATLRRLRALPGIGDWTAQYIAMRVLRDPDAFPAADSALQKALGLTESTRRDVGARAMSEVWAPWRSYAVLRAWHGLHAFSRKTG